jgi:tetratricopeptide (TPR) repeat protein
LQDARAPIEVFCSYAHEDEPLCHELEKHLSLLKRQGLISTWYDRQIIPGTDWAHAIDTHLKHASVILLLISSDFLFSDYCFGIEMERALQRQEANEARVIPILLRPVDWTEAPFGHLQILPTDAKPITTWSNRDEAFADVAAGIRRAIQDLALFEDSIPRAALPTMWNIPYPRNSFFIGREDILSRLHTQFQAGQDTGLSQPQAISGLGGIGKTQLAAEYAYRFRKEYRAVFWVHAESFEALASSYVSIAALLKLPERDAQEQSIAVQAVKIWLQTHREWLLILDNADELDVLPSFLPPATSGHLLVTTRASAPGHLARLIEIEAFPPKQGALFLLQRSALLAPDASLEQASSVDRDLALQVTWELGGLPLALDQAGAYLEATGYSLSEYQQIFRQHRADLLKERRGLVPDHPAPVATTWSLSFERVEQKSPAAAELLRLCAYLSPDSVAEEIFLQGAPYLGPLLAPVATDAFLLGQAIEALRAYSLVGRDPMAKTLSMHRLVQTVLKQEMDIQTYHQWAQRAVLAVNAAFPEAEFKNWPVCERLLPHAQVCATLIDERKMSFPEAAHLLQRTGSYLQDRGQFAQAEKLITQALAISQQTFGFDHPNLAPLLINLGFLADYYHQDRIQAEQYYQRAVTIREQALGSNHPDVATSLNKFALFYYYQGKERYSLVESLLQRVLTIREQTLEPNHPAIAMTLNDLGRLYHRQGKYEQAEQFCQRALTIYKQTLEPDNPLIGTSLNNLAKIYRSQQEYDEAEKFFQQALIIREQSLRNHPDVAETLEDLAKVYIAQGKQYETVEMYGEGELRPEHEKRYEEAALLYKRALTIRTQVLGPSHPSVDSNIRKLVELYKSESKYVEIEQLYQEAMNTFEQIQGPDHPSTINARNNYTRLLQDVKREQENEAQRKLEAMRPTGK